MSVQVVYKNKGKSRNSGVIALFSNEALHVKNLLGYMSNDESSYIQKKQKKSQMLPVKLHCYDYRIL